MTEEAGGAVGGQAQLLDIWKERFDGNHIFQMKLVLENTIYK